MNNVHQSLWTFVFETANFVALAAILAWLLFKPVRKALADQQAKTRQLEQDAAQKLTDAQHLRDEIASQQHKLASELDATRAKTLEAAKQEAAEILADARAHADRERAALKREALNIEKAQATKIAQAVAVATHNTVKQFLQQMEGPDLERTLLKAACRELQAFSHNSLAPVTVESATELDGDARELITKSLGPSAKTANFRVVPELNGGLRVSTARGLIDASVAGLANFAGQSLSAEMQSIIREESESE